TCCGARAGPRRCKRSVWEDHRETKHHVLDASVTARFLAGRPRRDEATDGRPRQRARIVPEREPARVELLLEGVAVDSGFARADEVGLVDLEDAIEGAHVHHDLARGRRERATDATPSTHRRDGDALGSGPAQHVSDLVSARRAHDEYARWDGAGALIHDRERPEVADRTLVDRGHTDDLLEVGPHASCLAAKRPASQPVRMGTPKPHGPA